MWYIGIDLHKRHLNICARNEQGKIVLRQQVSTEWSSVDDFLQRSEQRTTESGGYRAMLEVCGFEGWLIHRLIRHGCRGVHVIAPKERVRQKTDRRDAAKLSEVLWINRHRIEEGKRLMDVKEVHQPTEDERYDRELTRLRHRLGKHQTRVKNGIQKILRRHNLHQECPTKGVFTKSAMRWLRTLSLPEMERTELDMLLVQYDMYADQIQQVEAKIHQRAQKVERIPVLRTVARMGEYSALAVSAYVGPIKRFERAQSLPNFFGITPGCRNSGETDRPGGITKAGHPFIRFLLGQMVLHALRDDPGLRRWYRKVKQRRGTKVARVAVMRRLCEAIWYVLTTGEPYKPVDVLRAERMAQPRKRSRRSGRKERPRLAKATVGGGTQ